MAARALSVSEDMTYREWTSRAVPWSAALREPIVGTLAGPLCRPMLSCWCGRRARRLQVWDLAKASSVGQSC